MAATAAGPHVLSEEIPQKLDDFCGELDLARPLGGPLWWNSLLWTNFPPLSMFSDKNSKEGNNSDFFASLAALNTDKRLSEQYVTFTAARHDLCNSSTMPKKNCRLTVECMQYEGVRECQWNFPLQDYIPKRDNHQTPEAQARRFWDNNVLHMGLNAEEFSDKVMPVGDIQAEIRIADYAGNPTWGYYPCIMRVGGWPFRIRKIGSFEGFGKGGHHELNIGLHYFEQEKLWNLLEGYGSLAATGSQQSMELQGNQRKGFKFYAMLTDLDWLGPNMNDKKYDDPEVPAEKGYVWFTVEETITSPTTSPYAIGKAVKIKLLDEGIVPAWLDLHYLQVFAGGVPLGYMSEAHVDLEKMVRLQWVAAAAVVARCKSCELRPTAVWWWKTAAAAWSSRTPWILRAMTWLIWVGQSLIVAAEVQQFDLGSMQGSGQKNQLATTAWSISRLQVRHLFAMASIRTK